MNRSAAVVATLLSIGLTCSCAAKTIRIYVAKDGRNSWSGRLIHPADHGSNGPLATLAAARDAIEAIRQKDSKAAANQFVVEIEPGTYRLSQSFALGAGDGGSTRYPLIYRAMRPGSVVITGGPQNVDWTHRLPARAASLFTPIATPHLLACNLAAAGISTPGDLQHRGFGASTPVVPTELFYRGDRMHLARWPATGYMQTALPVSKMAFGYSGDLPPGVTKDSDVWVHGYWNFDWAETYDEVGSIDTLAHVVHTVGTVTAYPYKAQRRFYFLNVPGALRDPDQYYIDRVSNTLYFWPPAGFKPSECVLSQMTQPLIAMTGTRNLLFSGCILEADRGDGISVNNGKNVVFKDCTIRDMGLNGIDFTSCLASGVDRCKVDEIGDAGVGVFCGDRATLIPAKCFVRNCTIHDYAQWDYTYHPGVMLDGVGNIVEHNDIYNSPHQAILFNGNNHLIQYNNIHNVCTETGDAGAVYDGRDLTQRGTVIRYNYFHDLVPTLHTPGNYDDVMAVYLDDCLCGTTIEYNIFQNAGHSIMVGGGRDNVVRGNLFIRCNPCISVDARGLGWAKDWFASPNGIMLRRLDRMHYNQPPYSTEYPHLADILQDDPQAPKYNVIAGNICIDSKWLIADGLPQGAVTVENNMQFTDAAAAGINSTTFAVKPNGPAATMGFPSLPVHEMGVYKPRKH